MQGITVVWQPSPNSASSLPTNTHLERSDNGGSFTEVMARAYGETAAALTYLDQNVIGGHSYTYRQRFEGPSGFGAYSPVSAPVSFPLPPPLPIPSPSISASLV
jgi:hypothetical protein